MTGSGGLTGTEQLLGATGGPGGTPQGMQSCATDNPAYALYGRSGSWLDSFGMICRQAEITPVSVNSIPEVVNPGSQVDVVGTPVSLQIGASDSDGDPLTYSATGLPDGLAINSTTGLIAGTPTTANIYNVSVTASDGDDADTENFDWTINSAQPLTVDPMPPQPSREVNTLVNYTASSSGGVNVVYKWDFGDGTPETAYSSSPSVSHTFVTPGVNFVTLTVNDDSNNPIVQSFVQTIHLPLTANAPAKSSRVILEERAGSNDRVWVINQDNDSVSVIDAVSLAKVGEIAVGVAPRSIAQAPDGRMWVTNKQSATLSIIDPASLVVMQTVSLPHASAPYGIAFSPLANNGFVVLEASGQLVQVDSLTGDTILTAGVGPHPRHVAVDSSGTKVYVSRFITPPQPGEDSTLIDPNFGGTVHGGEIVLLDASTLAQTKIIVLQHSDKPDAENQGSGVPNYLGPVSISPDGSVAFVPSKMDNIGRGSQRSGLNLNFQNTVRAIASVIDTGADSEDYPARLDLDNSSVTAEVAYDSLGIYGFMSLETSREVAVIDVHAGFEMFRINTGIAPQGIALSADGMTLFVNNFMDRTLEAFDLTDLQEQGLWSAPSLGVAATVAAEKLSPQVLLGKQHFYDAWDTRLARDKYLSCATCHNDGGYDGRTWDLKGMGEGLRNTINLRGSGAAHGRLHWSQNFDEVQDFEGQIRTLSGGTGLMSDADFNTGTRSQPLGDAKAGISPDLDALAAYVASLDTFDASPFRNSDGTLTASGAAGREVFRAENCAACHSGTEFTDSDLDQLHDIGTLKVTSGERLNGVLTGIDTPTLRGVAFSAPYLHDGSALTLADAVNAHAGVSLSGQDLSDLVSYLQQIDDNEASAPLPNVPPTVTNPGAQNTETGEAVSLQIDASDSDGDTLSYSSSTLPAGLTINNSTGLITGSPTTAGTSSVTVSVSDALSTSNVTFNWEVTQNSPPTVTDPGSQSTEVGDPVSLQIDASDADGDTLSYSSSTLPAGLSINGSTGLITGSPTTAGTSNVTVSVSDGPTTTDVTFSWEVTQNSPPTVTNPGSQSTEVGDPVSLQIEASDDDGDTLSYSSSTLPAGLSINSSTGLITGSPTTAGSSSVTVSVSDALSTSDVTFNWEVTQNSPPTVTNPGTQNTETGEAVSLQIEASDDDGDTLSYSSSTLPAGLAINSSTGLITGSPTTTGTSNVTVSVSDGPSTTDVTFSWEVTPGVDTEAPSKPEKPNWQNVGGFPMLSWIPATDNVGVTGYIVYRSTDRKSNGQPIAQTSATSYHDQTIQTRVRYYYRIQAVDAAGNQSPLSDARQVRTR